jgi:hypothetical protein
MSTQNYNRAIAIGATGLFLVLSLLIANFSTPKSSDPLRRRPSTMFTDPSGARALFLVMRRLLPSAEQWRRPLYRLSSDGLGAASSLIVADPKIPMSENESAALERWLKAGGQLILLSQNGWPMRAKITAETLAKQGEENNDDAESDEPTVTFLSRYVPELGWAKPVEFSVNPARGSSMPESAVKLRWRQSFAAVGDRAILAAVADRPLAIEIPVGQGRIVAVADPTMISNGSLRRSDNAVWLVNLVAGWGDGRVLFDEYHHGFGEKQGLASLARAFAATPWGWCFGQIAVAGLLYIFCYRRRFGRVSEPPVFQRSDPLDQVDARAGIFAAAGAQRLASQLILQNLSQELSQAHGRTIDVTSANAPANLAAPTAPAHWAELRALAAKVEGEQSLTEREFIALGRLAGTIAQGRKA